MSYSAMRLGSPDEPDTVRAVVVDVTGIFDRGEDAFLVGVDAGGYEGASVPTEVPTFQEELPFGIEVTVERVVVGQFAVRSVVPVTSVAVKEKAAYGPRADEQLGRALDELPGIVQSLVDAFWVWGTLDVGGEDIASVLPHPIPLEAVVHSS